MADKGLPVSSDALSTVDRAIDLLFHLHAQPAPQGVTAASRALGLPKSTTHRLLTALASRGLVERDARGHYRPGIGLVTLGLGVLESEPLVALGRRALEASAHAIGETFFLVAARARSLVVLDKAEGTGFLRAAPRVGQSVPVHATAVGKLYLAHAPHEVDTPDAPSAFTEQTHTDSEAIAEQVREAAARGYATNHEEWIAGLAVIAAPVWHYGASPGDGAERRLVAAVAMAGASAQIAAHGSEALAKHVIETAETISRRFSGELSGGPK